MSGNRTTIARAAILPVLFAALTQAAACGTDQALGATTVLAHEQCQGLQAGVSRVDWEEVAALRDRHILGMTGNGGGEERDLLMVAISRGEQPTAGYAMRLTGARRESGTAVVDVQWDTPAPDAMVAQVLTHPCLVVGLSEADVGGLNRVEARDQHGTVLGGISR